MKKIDHSKDKLIYIEWEDATSRSGWSSDQELENYMNSENTIISEVGWVFKENKKYLMMYSRRCGFFSDYKNGWKTDNLQGDEGYDYGLLQKIPKTWIRKKILLDKYVK